MTDAKKRGAEKTGSEKAGAEKAGSEKAGFQLGWDAAVAAAQHWHEGQAQQAMVQSRRSRFPKNHEREAEWHTRCAGMMALLSPEDF